MTNKKAKRAVPTAFSLEGIGFIALAPECDPARAYALLKAEDALFAISDFLEEVRKLTKYGHTLKKSDDALVWARDKMLEICADRGIYLDDFGG